MLNRYQVLLPDWLETYIKYLVERYDLSFSEVIRVELCISILGGIMQSYPDYEPKISLDQVFNQEFRSEPDSVERDDILRHISKIYFETRKAIEYQNNLMQKKSPKKEEKK
jgi:hypothetical protein